MTSRVKAVQSGDTLILNTETGEKQVILAYVQVPRITEPFGFLAREYLRKFALNKPLRYHKLYEVNGREFGDAAAPVFNSLVEHMIQQGWAKLRNDASTRPGFTPQLAERLEAAQQQAQSKGIGIWSEKKPVPVVGLLTEVPAAVYGSGRKVPAMIEKVQNGDRVILRAMLTDKEHYVGPAFIGGIRVRPPPAGQPLSGQALAAVRAVESRLLQRDVRAIFHAEHPSGHPIVTLVHPQGDIAQVLVSQGLAEVQQTPVIGSEEMLLLRNAEQEAIKKGVGIWRAAAQQRNAAAEQFAGLPKEGIVTRVISADTVVVGDTTVRLSSVRAPRRGENAEAAADAKEFARKLLIGQPVKVAVDGTASVPAALANANAKGEKNEKSESKPEPVVTLSFGPKFNRNAGLEIIQAGWATALRHRRDDQMRSPFYDEFVRAEQGAEQKHVGMYAKKKSSAPSRATQDASESVVRARAYLPALQRKGNFSAVVDFVISAGRLRLAVPAENCTIVVVLDGARAPPAGSPFSEEALAFVQREWNQRDVTCTVTSVDKTGAFVSTIRKGGHTLAMDLVERGLATVFGSAHPELEAAEEKAESKKLGVWSIEKEEPAKEAEPQAEVETAAAVQQDTPAVITHVTPTQIYVRLAPQEGKHSQLQAALRDFFTAAANASARNFERRPQRRTPVVDAHSYERGTVFFVHATKCDVEFVDTGVQRNLDVADLLPLPQQFGFTKQPPLAQALKLQFVHSPVALYKNAYLQYLNTYVGKTVSVRGGIVTPVDKKSDVDTLNYRLVAEGYASVPVAEEKEEGAKPALEAQQRAMEERKGMWQYGDPREDEDM